MYDQPWGAWDFRYSGGPDAQVHFGWWETIPVPADYDGDGVTDLGVYYPAIGGWYVFCSREGYFHERWGWNEVVPVPADYDGDGRADIAVFHRAAAMWYVSYSGGGEWAQAFGWSTVIPVPADYDGDGKADIAVYHPVSGIWYVRQSSDDTTVVKAQGRPGAFPVSLYPLIHAWYGLP